MHTNLMLPKFKESVWIYTQDVTQSLVIYIYNIIIIHVHCFPSAKKYSHYMRRPL